MGLTLRQEDMPFTESGISPDVIINPNCLSGDSTVLLDNREVVTIKEIVENNGKYSVKTIDPESFKESDTDIKNEFTIMPDKKMYKIRTWSGREIKCTADHPFLLWNGEWKNAEDIVPNSDKIVVNHMVDPVDHTVNDEDEILNIDFGDDDRKYVKQLKKLGYEGQIDLDRIKILARLFGAVESDGHLSKRTETSYRYKAYLGEIEDFEEIRKDVVALGFPEPTVRETNTKFKNKQNGKEVNYHTYSVEINPCLGYLMHYLGATIGRKSTQIRKVPSWIKNGPKCVKRNFIAGFQGGDGSVISVNYKQVQQQVRIKETAMTSRKTVLETNKKYMEDISTMLKDFDIDSTVTIYKAKDENSMIIMLRVLVANDNLNRYMDQIDYRYCAHKRRRSLLPIEYHKARRNGYRMEYLKFIKCFQTKNDMVSMFVESVEEIEKEPVYDFTTVAETHSFIANGLVVHNCIPSRMTIGQLIECVMGKISAIRGHASDGTPFNNLDVDAMRKELEELGYHDSGEEYLYNGMTGKKIKSRIFIGPTYYQRLKHMVDDKIHSRARGPRQLLTHQPPEGKFKRFYDLSLVHKKLKNNFLICIKYVLVSSI